MSDEHPQTPIYDLAERIAEEVAMGEPDWPVLAQMARELASLCESQARDD